MRSSTLSGKHTGDISPLTTSDAENRATDLEEGPQARLRIVVIDDERTLRESCASILEMDGHDVTTVGKGGAVASTWRSSTATCLRPPASTC